jgi:hypothetical protein
MTYEYEHRPETGEGTAKVADVYVVRDASQRVAPSREFLAAAGRLSPLTQAVLRRLLDVGFQSVVRK